MSATLCPKCVINQIEAAKPLGTEPFDLRDQSTKLQMCWEHRNYSLTATTMRAIKLTASEYEELERELEKDLEKE